jgi:hypothetical protein
MEAPLLPNFDEHEKIGWQDTKYVSSFFEKTRCREKD